MTSQNVPVDAADLIWNRAALEKGGTSPGVGDHALADLLAFHGLAMNGGVLDAIERTSPEGQARIGVAFRWFGLESVDHLLASVRRDIEAVASMSLTEPRPWSWPPIGTTRRSCRQMRRF